MLVHIMFSSMVILLAILPDFHKASAANCSEATDLLIKSNRVLEEAHNEQADYMMSSCSPKPNNVCSIRNETDGENFHLKATINMNVTEAYDINKKFDDACKNAGGLLVLETYDIGLKNDGNYLQYYSIEEETYVNSYYFGTYFDFSTIGYLDCVDKFKCTNETEIIDIAKNSWAFVFNASVYNFTLFNIQLENITYPK